MKIRGDIDSRSKWLGRLGGFQDHTSSLQNCRTSLGPEPFSQGLLSAVIHTHGLVSSLIAPSFLETNQKEINLLFVPTHEIMLSLEKGEKDI